MNRIAYLSMDDLAGYFTYEGLTHEALATYGIEAETVSWRARDMDWARFDMVVIRSTWDYQRDAAAFLDTLTTIDAATHLENSLHLCRWNLSKTYLRELAGAGVAIVETVWGDTTPPDAGLFRELDSDEIVLKPVISANADHTHRLTPEAFAAQHDTLRHTFRARPWMAQPFMTSIVEEGEYSLFYFDGIYSHAILKTPGTGDFRVQEEHGGRIRAVTVEPSLRDAADSCMTALPGSSLYARVDLLRDTGTWRIIEVELIEPSLYFPYDTRSPERFAQAIRRRLDTGP